MREILASPMRSLMLGALVAVALVSLWIAFAGVDAHGFAAFALRVVHVIAAVVWVGMIWFVNFVQLVAVAEAAPTDRSAIVKHIVPRVALTFRHASHLTIVSGVLLLAAAGYLLDQLVFATEVFIPPAKSAMLWAGVVGALAMYAFVHMMIWPNLQKVLGIVPADEASVALARVRVASYARWNLILALPVTVAMIAAAHLY